MTDSRDFQFAPHWRIVSFVVAAIGVFLVIHHLTSERYFYGVVWAIVTAFTFLQGIKTTSSPALSLTEDHVELYRTPIIPPLSVAFSTIEELVISMNALRIRVKSGRKYRWSMLWLNKDEREVAVKLIRDACEKYRSPGIGA